MATTKATTIREHDAQVAKQSAKSAAAAKRAYAATPKAKATAAKAAAAKAKPATTTRRVFAPGQCHHRNAKGAPDCKQQIVAKRANLCPAHEAIWQKAARQRYAANRAARAVAPTADATTTNATQPEELEAALAASVSRFATPELAAQAAAKRAARRASSKAS
jgi:hypothetical protein